jgi:hypothetical protein
MKNETEISADDAVTADALTVALDALSKAMQKGEADKGGRQINLFDDAEDMEERDMEERDMDAEDMDAEDMDAEDMDKNMDEEDMDVEKAYYRDAMKALAESSDRVVGDMEKRLDAVMKAVEAMMTEMKGMKSEREGMSKSLAAVLNQPIPARAVTSAAAPTPTAPVGPTRGDVIRKGLTQLRDNTNLSNNQRGAIRGAIAQLEAGVAVSAVSHIIDVE